MKRPLFLSLFALALFIGGLTLYLVLGERARRARMEGPSQYQLLPAAVQALEAPGHMTLYSLDPVQRSPLDRDLRDPGLPVSGLFHDFLILGETNVVAPADRQRVSQEIQQAVAAADGPPAMCFEPRHGVRVARDSQTFDFLICFECDAIYTFVGQSHVASGALHGTPTVINEFLRAAEVPLTPPSEPNVPSPLP